MYLKKFILLAKLSIVHVQGQFKDGTVKGLGLITFSDGSSGQPRKEGLFEGLELVQRCSAREAIQAARQSAANARGLVTRH